MNQFNLFGIHVPSKAAHTTQSGTVIIENGEYIFIPVFLINWKVIIIFNH